LNSRGKGVIIEEQEEKQAFPSYKTHFSSIFFCSTPLTFNAHNFLNLSDLKCYKSATL
jgi:hypothetical protein